MSIFSLINPLMAQSSDTIPDIRKICFDFMLSKGEVSKDSEKHLYLTEDDEKKAVKERIVIIPSPIVYDMTNKKDIIGHDPVPVQESLIKYWFQVFSSNSFTYLLLVKNGVYEVIDMNQLLSDVLNQVLRYGKNNSLTSDELLDVLDTVLFIYQQNGGMVVTTKNVVQLDSVFKKKKIIEQVENLPVK